MKTPLPVTLVAGLVVALTTTPLSGTELRTIGGDRLAGDLVRISPEGITLRTSEGERTVPVREAFLLDMGAQAAAPPETPYTLIELVEGTRILCTAYSIRGESVEVELARQGGGGPERLTVPVREVFAIARDAAVTAQHPDWKQLLKDRATRDLLVTARGDRLSGLPGTAVGGSADGSALKFRLAAGRDVDIPLARLQGLILSQPPRAVVAPTICKVFDAGGNLFHAREIAFSDGELTLTTVSGIVVGYSRPEALARLDFSQGNLTYLSDMDPETVLESTLEFGGGVARDVNLDGNPLELDGESYAKGLSVHPRGELTYNLRGDYKEFRMVLGVDDSVQTDSHVRVKIETDGRPVYETEVRRDDEPRPISLNVTGVDALRIVVESARPLDLGNQVNFADARLSK